MTQWVILYWAEPQSLFSPTLPALLRSFWIGGVPPGFSRKDQWQDEYLSELMVLWLTDTLDVHYLGQKTTCVVLPCGGQRVADVEVDSLCWETVSYTASRPTLSSPSACPGLLHHRQALLPPPQGHCLHCRLPQGHTNHSMDKQSK